MSRQKLALSQGNTDHLNPLAQRAAQFLAAESETLAKLAQLDDQERLADLIERVVGHFQGVETAAGDIADGAASEQVVAALEANTAAIKEQTAAIREARSIAYDSDGRITQITIGAAR